eukprot:gene2383-4627_t
MTRTTTTTTITTTIAIKMPKTIMTMVEIGFDGSYLVPHVLICRNPTTNKEHTICPKCFRDPPGPPDAEAGAMDFRCFNCAHSCPLAGRTAGGDIPIAPCAAPGCEGIIRIKRLEKGIVGSCSAYPACPSKNSWWLPKAVKSAIPDEGSPCPHCNVTTIMTMPRTPILMLRLDIRIALAPAGTPPQLLACPCCNGIWNDLHSSPLPRVVPRITGSGINYGSHDGGGQGPGGGRGGRGVSGSMSTSSRGSRARPETVSNMWQQTGQDTMTGGNVTTGTDNYGRNGLPSTSSSSSSGGMSSFNMHSNTNISSGGGGGGGYTSTAAAGRSSSNAPYISDMTGTSYTATSNYAAAATGEGFAAKGRRGGATQTQTRGGRTAGRRKGRDGSGPSGDGAAPGPGPPCKCDEPSVRRVVAKEGPNKGKGFFACGKPRDEQCGFFEWENDDNSSVFTSGQSSRQSGRGGGAVGGDTGGAMICSHCKQRGHYSRMCPNK